MSNIVKGIKLFLGLLSFGLVLNVGIMANAEPATVITNAKIRSSADTSSAVVASAKQNQTLDVISSTTGTDGKTWYLVWVDANSKGYVRSDLVSMTASVPQTTATTVTTTQTAAPAKTEDTSETAVTSVEAKAAYVTTDNVRIRKGASTNHGIVGTAKRGMSVTISGEATGSDSKKWYQIQFTYNNQSLTGFIRSDFVTFEPIANEAAVTEITGGEAEEPVEEAPQEEAPIEEAVEEPVVEEPQPQQTSVQLLNPGVEPYVLSGFSPIKLSLNGEDYDAYVNGSFYLLYANVNGVQGWYLFDSSIGTYARYPYDVDAVAGAEKKANSGVLPVIILVVIIVALMALSGYLYIRLREYTVDDSDEDDDEDDDYEDEKPVRQASREEQHRTRPAPRPQSQVRAQGQARPQGQSNRPAQARPGQPRPQGQARPQNQARPGMARTEQQKKVDHELRRPQGAGVKSQPVKKAVNQGMPARNFIESGDDGDIEFIDL